MLKKKPAQESVPDDEEPAFADLDELFSNPTTSSHSSVNRRKLVVLDSDEEDYEDDEAEMARLIRQEKAREMEAPRRDDTTPETEKERKRRKKEKRELARTNQQLLIQTALLGGDTEVPKKIAVKMSEFSFAQRVKERLQCVVGRFAPDAKEEADVIGGQLCLTADMEACGSQKRRPMYGDDDEDEDELVVVAEEPQMKLEAPRTKPAFSRGDLDSIFGADGVEMVGETAFDSSRVWVSQFRHLQGVDLWDPKVSFVVMASEQLSATNGNEEESSDGEYRDDHEIDENDLFHENEEEDNLDLANNNDNANSDSDVLELSDSDGAQLVEDDADALSSSSGSSQDPRRNLGLSLSIQESFDGGNSVMGSVVEEQGIGFLLNNTIKSQQSQQSQQSQRTQQELAMSQKQSVLDILTPKKPSIAAVALPAMDVDELDDDNIFEDERDEYSPPVKRSLSLQWDDEDANDALEFPASQSLVDGLSQMTGMQSQDTQVQLLESQKTPPTLPMAPSAPAPTLVIDPIERAKRQASAGKGLDRFIVRGDAAKKLAAKQFEEEDDEEEELENDLIESPARNKRYASDEEDDDNDEDRDREDDDVFDDEGDDEEVSRPRQKKKAKSSVSFFDDEAVLSGEDEASGSGSGEEEDDDEEGDEDEDNEEDPELTAAKAQESEDIKALNRLHMEKDLHELNRIKDLYVLGHWKTEKMQNRQQVGMEDYVDDEFAPAWNSIYNRDAIRNRLNKKKEGQEGDDEANQNGQDEGDEQDGQQRKEAAEVVDSSDDEEEYERKREKLKQSMQIAKINALFVSEGSFLGSGDSVSGFQGAGEASMDGLMGVGAGASSVSHLIENRRESSLYGSSNSNFGIFASNSNANPATMSNLATATSSAMPTASDLLGGGSVSILDKKNSSTSFGALARDKTADMDPLQRFAMRRSSSKLLQTAQDNNLKRSRSSSNIGGAINTGGRTFFSAGDENNSNSAMGVLAPPAPVTGAARRKPTTPKRLKVPPKPKTPTSSLLMRKFASKAKRNK